MSRLKLILNNSWLSYIQIRKYTQKYDYIMPDTYRNAFYLANSTLEDNTNWFMHTAIEVIYSELIEDLKSKGCTALGAMTEISNVVNLLEPCNNFIDLKFPVKRCNGKYELFRGFRAEHGTYITKRPCLGGLRLCTNIIKSDIKALACLSTYKYACMGIDMLGAHGGIMMSPKEVTQEELPKIIERYAAELTKKGFCGESVDVFEPDIKCGRNVIMRIAAANSKTRGDVGNCCVVGKPTEFGGLKNREKVVAQGISFGLDTFLQNQNIMKSIGLEMGWHNKTFILQGLGNVGSYVAEYLVSMGVKCVGILDSDCYIYDIKGLNIKEASLYKRRHGTLEGFNLRTKCIDPNSILKGECDILVLAAFQNSVPYFIADKVQAKIIIEAANGPLTPSVHKIFVARNKLVLPDIYINAGSSLASYFEYLNSLQNSPVKNTENFNDEYSRMLKLNEDVSTDKGLGITLSDRKVLRDRIMADNFEKCIVTTIVDKTMEDTAKLVIATAEKYKLGLDFRTAAYIIAVKKLFWKAYDNLKIL